MAAAKAADVPDAEAEVEVEVEVDAPPVATSLDEEVVGAGSATRSKVQVPEQSKAPLHLPLVSKSTAASQSHLSGEPPWEMQLLATLSTPLYSQPQLHGCSSYW